MAGKGCADMTDAELDSLTNALKCTSVREQMHSRDIAVILQDFKAVASECTDLGRLLSYLRLIRNMVAGVEKNTSQVVEYFDSSFNIWVSGIQYFIP
jgi:hypothetical protein